MEPKTAQILRSVARRLTVDFELSSAQISHSGEKGRAREVALVQEYLSKFLPRSVRVVHNCEILSVVGDSSPQTDVCIIDPNTPPLLDEHGFTIVPNECVYGVIEVESYLDKRELRDAHKKIVATKRLQKLAYRRQQGPIAQTAQIFGREWTDSFPTLGFVFAYDGADTQGLRDELESLNQGPPWERVDAAWILKKGFVANWHADVAKLQAFPSDSSTLVAAASDNPLFFLTIELQRIFEGAWMHRFDISKYMSGTEYGRFL